MIRWKKWKEIRPVKVNYEHTDATYGIGNLVKTPEATAVPVQVSDDKTIKCPKCGKMVERGRVVKRKVRRILPCQDEQPNPHGCGSPQL